MVSDIYFGFSDEKSPPPSAGAIWAGKIIFAHFILSTFI